MHYFISHYPLRAAGLIAILSMGMASIASAADAEPRSGLVKRNPASARIGFETITLPGNEPMGMIGTSYLVELTPGIYLGPAAYGAITGQRGGFYTGGGELAWRYKLTSRLALETGVYAGAGGGGAAAVGGGLMIRPHVDLMWDFGGYRAGISASNVRFPNGSINSNQIGLMLDFDTEFRRTGFGYVGEQLPVTERTGVGFDRVLLLAGTYQPRKNAALLSGAPMPDSIKYAGMRMERLIYPNVFVGIEANGANAGGVAGYAEYLGTAGAEVSMMNKRLTLGTRLALGMGGGGAVPVGGGAMVKAGVYATANVSRDFHVNVEGGVAHSPDGDFRASYGSLALIWNLDHPYSTATTSSMVVNEWVVGTQRYLKAARKGGPARDMDSVTLKLNRYVTDSFYLTGQAHSAYNGQAGGYSVGLMGAGYRTPRNKSGWYAGAELSAGAAGGGGVDTSGGVVMQPIVFVGMGVSKSVSARLSVGKIKSRNGALNSNVVELGLSYAFGTTSRD